MRVLFMVHKVMDSIANCDAHFRFWAEIWFTVSRPATQIQSVAFHLTQLLHNQFNRATGFERRNELFLPNIYVLRVNVK